MESSLTAETVPVTETFKPLFAHSVLLIEDNTTDISLLEMLLTHAGLKVQTASTEEEAMSLAKKFVPDLILASWETDGLDSRKVVRRLRKEIVRYARIPAILMTRRDVGRSIGLSLAQQDFKWILQKPIVATSLPKLIDQTVCEAYLQILTARASNAWQGAPCIGYGQTASSMFWGNVSME